jgi:hypothetical protein
MHAHVRRAETPCDGNGARPQMWDYSTSTLTGKQPDEPSPDLGLSIPFPSIDLPWPRTRAILPDYCRSRSNRHRRSPGSHRDVGRYLSSPRDDFGGG